MQTAKVQVSLHIHAVLPESMLFAHVNGRSRGNLSQRNYTKSYGFTKDWGIHTERLIFLPMWLISSSLPRRTSMVILSLPLIQGHLSVSGKIMCTILVNCLED